jgi:hypothetical protein
MERRSNDGGGPEPPKIGFRASVAGSYNEFIATKSANSDLFANQRFVSGMGGLRLTILPQRPFGGDVYADALRSVQPSNDPTFNFNRVSARFGGGVTWAPGGGMFDWRLGYEYGVIYFEDRSFRNLSNDAHSLNTRGRWRFLPRTALLYDASASFIRYNRDPSPAQLNSNPIRARLGLNGLVTRQLALLAMAGWASSFYSGTNSQQYDGVIAQAELKWFITPGTADLIGGPLPISTAALGYTRDFINSYLGDFMARNRFYLALSHLFAGRVLVVADAGYSPMRFPTIYEADRTTVRHGPFTAPFVDASIFGEYRFSDSLGANATFRYTANATDVSIQGDYLGWNRIEAYLGVRWFL